MEDWSHSPWTEFQVRRERYTKEAENARLAGEGKSAEAEDSNSHGWRLGSLAINAIRFLLHWHASSIRQHPV